MGYMVDIKQVEQLSADMRAKYEREGAEQPGWEGMCARLQGKILPTLIVAMAEEVNRGASPEDVTNAVAAVMSDMVVNTRGLVGASDGMRELSEHAVSMIQQMADYLKQFISGNMRKVSTGGVVTMRPVGDTTQ
jgi:hypothetical protein